MKRENGKFKDLLNLIKPNRHRTSSRGRVSLLQETESDKGRVINSAAFRRLQQKTQVFPLEANAAVRSRLTHSIEVSQIGRFLTQKIIEQYDDKSSFSYEELASFANIVEAACLLHDIGNPPFGHLGESAIKEWAKNTAVACQDLVEFDGNPQGFRLMSYLQGTDTSGMNLTYSLLLSTIKYPRSTMKRTEEEKGKKIGLFHSDWDLYQTASSNIGWTAGKKFPFAQLMEAADDIAYSMSDLEDGLEKNIIRRDDLKNEFQDIWTDSTDVDPFLTFKTTVIRNAVDEAATAFVGSIDDALNGQDLELVSPARPNGKIIDRIKTYTAENIYTHDSAELLEISGRNIISSLLEDFEELRKLPIDDFDILLRNDRDAARKKGLDYQMRLCRRLPDRYKNRYQDKDRGTEEQRRAHLIVDFVAGMTDDFALETHQLFRGIKIK